MAKLIEITGKALSGEWGSDDISGKGIPILRTTNFTNEGVVNYDNVVTRIITKKDLTEKYLRQGDIIIEKSGGSDKQPVGRVVYFDGPENAYLFNNFTGLLRVKDTTKWYPRFVFYALFSNYRQGGTRLFQNKTTGLHNLKTDDYVSRFEIKEIPIHEQSEVCRILDKVQLLIVAQKQQLTELNNLIKARFVEMFGDPLDEQRGWKKEEMRSVCNKITDGEHGSVPRIENGYPFLNARHIGKNGIISWTTATYIADEMHEKIYKRCNPEVGDILLTTTGTIGNVAIVPDMTPFSMDRGITLLKLNHQYVESQFMAWLLRFDSMQSIMNANIHASAIGHLFINKVEKLPVIVPPLELQNQFAAFVAQVDKSKVVVESLVNNMRFINPYTGGNRNVEF